MGFEGPPPDTLGEGAIEKPEEHEAGGTFEVPDAVSDHLKRT